MHLRASEDLVGLGSEIGKEPMAVLVGLLKQPIAQLGPERDSECPLQEANPGESLVLASKLAASFAMRRSLRLFFLARSPSLGI